MPRRLLALVTLALVTACRSGLLVVDPVATSVQRPSQVAVYLSVRAGDEPLTNLTASSFTLAEDGQRLDPAGVSLSLLERSVAAEHRTVLLLDASALSPGPDADAIARAAEAFARRVGTTQAVSVYAFDGSETLRPVAGVQSAAPAAAAPADAPDEADRREPTEAAKEPDRQQAAPVATKIEGLAASSSDPSRDLYGAVLRGLDKLDEELSRADKPVRVGTLVVFARGPDLAGRVSAERLRDRLNGTSAAVVLIRAGAEKDAAVERMGRDGLIDVASLQKVEPAFVQAAERVLAIERSHYLVAYCSPARAGERTLRIGVRVPGSGTEPATGSLRTHFDARGFSSGCDAKATPRFVVTLVSGRRGSIAAALPDGVETSAPGSSDTGKKPEPSPAAERAEDVEDVEEAPPAKPKPRAKPRSKPAAPPAEAPAAPLPPPPASPPQQDFEP